MTGISAGDSISFEEGGIFVLSPFGDGDALKNYGITGENDTSLVLRSICMGRIYFLPATSATGCNVV